MPATCSLYIREQSRILEFALVVEKDNKQNEKNKLYSMLEGAECNGRK